MSTKLGEINVRGTKVEYYIDERGTFFVRFDEETIKADTKAGLEKKLLNATRVKKARIAVLVTSYDGKHATLTGKHANGNLLIKWDDGRATEQLPHYSRHDLLKRLTPAQVKELQKLREAVRKASDGLESFLAVYHINVRDEVENALAAVLDAMSKTEEVK